MDVPISHRLRNKTQLSIAELQDKFVEAVYQSDSNIILHGGTAIWRCYSGNRFSYDVDAYIRNVREFNAIRHGLTFSLSRLGCKIDSISIIERSIFAVVSDQIARLSVDISYRANGIRPLALQYERIDRSYTQVLTLTPEDFVLEKVVAYESRGYIRDLFDIYQLLNYLPVGSRADKRLGRFAMHIKKPYSSEKLSDLVYSGVAPTFREIVEAIKRRTR